MGHGSKEMLYNVYGKYVQGLEADLDQILEYFGEDYLGRQTGIVAGKAMPYSESHSESSDKFRGVPLQLLDINKKKNWWAAWDSNPRPQASEACTLSN